MRLQRIGIARFSLRARAGIGHADDEQQAPGQHGEDAAVIPLVDSTTARQSSS